MGGDHKCPVCQATFTRPQHVARHMRSHTGDRPYKCVYCGDQFARSDLLSRHCNKCHANEKPLPNAGSRRRGSASAARATTSKQACDQCVQSSLPCDGSNPCAKCVQRKCRCTYVKFHRQTAPFGPGHNNPRPTTAGGPQSALMMNPHHDSTRMAMYPHADDFFPGQQQTLIPSMGDNLYSQPLGYLPSFSHAIEGPQLGENDIGATKYRQQSDPYRRASLPLEAHTSAGPGTGLLPGLYTDPRQTQSWMTWGQENDSSFTSANHHPEGIHDRNLQVELPHRYMEPQGVLMAPTADGTYSRPRVYTERHRRGSLDYNSEGSSAASHSVPSSAASSSVHLPMEGMTLHQRYPDQHPISPVVAAPHHDRAYAARGQEGGFSPAFGIMSLEEPGVLAGLSLVEAPFFSQNAIATLGSDDPNQTPMPAKQPGMVQQRSNTGPTPSKEAEIRELREFWKQYIRVPLSGPGPAAEILAQRHPPASPSISRRPRVASLPSTKSPFSVEPPKYTDQQPKEEANATSSMRTTLHGQEDLRSYEAAVLARKAPTTLSLGPRARRNNAAAVRSGSTSQTTSPQVPTIQLDPNFKFTYSPSSSRPQSASGSSSSLAYWSSKPPPLHAVYTHDKASTSSPPSRESSLSVDDSAGSGGSDRDGMRPTFKRLSSQTLGPLNTKRAQVSHEELGARPPSASSSGVPVPVYNSGGGGGGADDNGGATSQPSISVPGNSRPTDIHQQRHYEPLNPPLRHAERPIVNLADRQRRMSAPTSLVQSLPAFTFVAPPGPGPGVNP